MARPNWWPTNNWPTNDYGDGDYFVNPHAVFQHGAEAMAKAIIARLTELAVNRGEMRLTSRQQDAVLLAVERLKVEVG